MPTRTTGVYIVPDEARVVRVSEIVTMIEQGKGVREVAHELGVSSATISRALKIEGYSIQTVVKLVKE